MRNKYSTAVLRVDYDSKADFTELRDSFGLSSIDTLKYLCKFFKENYDYVITTRGDKNGKDIAFKANNAGYSKRQE
jgi:hypothetical protein